MNTFPHRLLTLAAALVVGTAFAATVNGTLQHDVMAKERLPSDNFGQDAQLQVSNQTGFKKITYVRFSVSGIPTGSTGISAVLRLRCEVTVTGRAVTAHAVSDITWTENAVTWNAKPALGALLSTVSNHT